MLIVLIRSILEENGLKRQLDSTEGEHSSFVEIEGSTHGNMFVQVYDNNPTFDKEPEKDWWQVVVHGKGFSTGHVNTPKIYDIKNEKQLKEFEKDFITRLKDGKSN